MNGSQASPWVVDGVYGGTTVLTNPEVGPDVLTINPKSGLFVAGESQMLGTAEMDPEDERWFFIEWGPLLNGDTVDTGSWEVPQGLVEETSLAPVVGTTQTAIQLSAHGAIPGKVYRVWCTMTSTAALIVLRRSFEITVRNL